MGGGAVRVDLSVDVGHPARGDFLRLHVKSYRRMGLAASGDFLRGGTYCAPESDSFKLIRRNKFLMFYLKFKVSTLKSILKA